MDFVLKPSSVMFINGEAVEIALVFVSFIQHLWQDGSGPGQCEGITLLIK